ncbi:MAG: hypothetical protein LBP43_06535, partial [Treponema sp.]|nr:hypothetical protein [Treponema sp.]
AVISSLFFITAAALAGFFYIRSQIIKSQDSAKTPYLGPIHTKLFWNRFKQLNLFKIFIRRFVYVSGEMALELYEGKPRPSGSWYLSVGGDIGNGHHQPHAFRKAH